MKISYIVNDSIDAPSDEQHLELNIGGFGITKSYKFLFSGLVENFNNFVIINISGACIF